MVVKQSAALHEGRSLIDRKLSQQGNLSAGGVISTTLCHFDQRKKSCAKLQKADFIVQAKKDFSILADVRDDIKNETETDRL